MLGEVYALTPDTRGYVRLVLHCKLPYKTSFKKYNIWNLSRLQCRLGTELEEGTMVQFEEDPDSKYPVLRSLELACLDTCVTCHSFYEQADAQRLECGSCNDGEFKERLDQSLKLQSKRENEYTYSKGLAITFVNDAEGATFSTCVFANSALYEGIQALTTGDFYTVKGWITQETTNIDGTRALIELEDIPQ